MRKIVVSALLIFFAMSGFAYAAGALKWNGFPIVNILSGGSVVKLATPAVTIQNQTYLPVSLLKKLGLTVKSDSRGVSVDMPEPVLKASPLSVQQLLDISKNVGIVYAYFPDGSAKQGSGFVVDGGYFITNYHVAGGANRLAITIEGKTYSTSGEFAFQDEDHDYYGVKIGATSTLKLNPVPPPNGSHVYAIGYPKAHYMVSEGVVVGTIELGGVKFTSNTARIDNGSSGGILLNEIGEVVGIPTIGLSGDKSPVMNFSYTISYVIDEISKLK
jgi:S1-C subfamily serine protease